MFCGPAAVCAACVYDLQMLASSALLMDSDLGSPALDSSEPSVCMMLNEMRRTASDRPRPMTRGNCMPLTHNVQLTPSVFACSKILGMSIHFTKALSASSALPAAMTAGPQTRGRNA